MNQGTSRNILKQLNMTDDDFNFVSTVYFVSVSLDAKQLLAWLLTTPDSFPCL